jgi:hypothetical protein
LAFIALKQYLQQRKRAGMTVKRIIGALWPFFFLLIFYQGLLRIGGSDKSDVLAVLFGLGCSIYVVCYVVASSFQWPISKAILVSLAAAFVFLVTTGWWILF